MLGPESAAQREREAYRFTGSRGSTSCSEGGIPPVTGDCALPFETRRNPIVHEDFAQTLALSLPCLKGRM